MMGLDFDVGSFLFFICFLKGGAYAGVVMKVRMFRFD
jgi:hypothetical protein